MSRDFDTQIKFGVQDNATPKIRSLSEEFRRMSSARQTQGVRTEQAIQRDITRTIAAWNQLDRSGTLSAKNQDRAYQQMISTVTRLRQEMSDTMRIQKNTSPMLQDYRRMASARETLGIRSEQTIRREISQTQAAYNRLARSGTMSASEQTRAWNQTQATIGRLRKELGETERGYQRLARAGKAVGAIGAGLAAGAMVLRSPVEKQMDYSLHLAETANFAYSKDGEDVRQKGKKIIDQAVRDAVRKGGGQPEQILGAFEAMIRAGNMDLPEVIGGLGDVAMNATANLADPVDVANLQSSIYGFGLSKKDASLALSATTTAAQHGRAGVALLAKELPGALSSARSAGFHGREGFAAIPALFQTAAKDAGTPEQGVTNAYNLMADLTSSNLANNAKNLMIKGKDGKTIKGVDFRSMSREDAKKGLTPLNTASYLIDRALAGNANYQALTKRLESTRDESERADIESQLNLQEGQYISQLFPNKYSGDAFRAYRKNQKYFNKLQHEMLEQFDLPDGQRSADLDYALLKNEPKIQLQKADNERFFATNDAVEPVSKALGDVAETGAKLAQEFPGLTTAVAGATVAITAMGAAAAVKGGVDLLTGRGAGKPDGAPATKGDGVKGGYGLSKGSGLLKWLGPVGEAIMAYEGMEDFPLIQVQRQKDKKVEAIKLGADPELAERVSTPGFLDAFDEIKNFFTQNRPEKQAKPGAETPYDLQDSLQPVVAKIYLDSREVTQEVLRKIDVDSRRN